MDFPDPVPVGFSLKECFLWLTHACCLERNRLGLSLKSGLGRGLELGLMQGVGVRAGPEAGVEACDVDGCWGEAVWGV